MPLSMIRSDEGRFRGEPAVVLQNGDLRAVFVPGIGMTGVSLRLRNKEYLALPGGLDALRTGHTGGLPLLAPWANRLASMRYKVGSRNVDLTDLGVHTDGNGLPTMRPKSSQASWKDPCSAVFSVTASPRETTLPPVTSAIAKRAWVPPISTATTCILSP